MLWPLISSLPKKSLFYKLPCLLNGFKSSLSWHPHPRKMHCVPKAPEGNQTILYSIMVNQMLLGERGLPRSMFQEALSPSGYCRKYWCTKFRRSLFAQLNRHTPTLQLNSELIFPNSQEGYKKQRQEVDLNWILFPSCLLKTLHLPGIFPPLQPVFHNSRLFSSIFLALNVVEERKENNYMCL